MARRAKYVGSKEHKVTAWWGGLPGIRVKKDGTVARPGKQKTTICPLVQPADQHMATQWVRSAIEAGQFDFTDGDVEFPKHLRYEANGQRWFGFLTNPGSGEYKGWPLEEDDD